MGQEKKIESEVKPRKEVEQNTPLYNLYRDKAGYQKYKCSSLCRVRTDFKDSEIVIMVSKAFIIKMTSFTV